MSPSGLSFRCSSFRFPPSFLLQVVVVLQCVLRTPALSLAPSVSAMPCTVDHVDVPVPLSLFPVRLARVRNVDGTVSVLATQLRLVVSTADVDALPGSNVTTEIRHLLVKTKDLNANAGRCKLGKSWSGHGMGYRHLARHSLSTPLPLVQFWLMTSFRRTGARVACATHWRQQWEGSRA